MTSKRRGLVAARLLLVLVAIIAFSVAWQSLDRGMIYVAETSSNPTPSAVAKEMGPKMMARSRAGFAIGLVFVVGIGMTLLGRKT